MKSPVSPAYAAAHKFTRTAESVAELADKLVAEFALLQQAAIDLQLVAPKDIYLEEIYARQDALERLLFEELQRLGAPWTHKPVMGRHTLVPMAKKAADIADAILRKVAA